MSVPVSFPVSVSLSVSVCLSASLARCLCCYASRGVEYMCVSVCLVCLCQYMCVLCVVVRVFVCVYTYVYFNAHVDFHMGWLWLVGSIKLQVSFAKELYKRDDILQKRLVIQSILLTVATP